MPQVLLVTGGLLRHRRALDSTELLNLGAGARWRVVTQARLPRPLGYTQAIALGDRILLFGELHNIEQRPTYEYNN